MGHHIEADGRCAHERRRRYWNGFFDGTLTALFLAIAVVVACLSI